MFGVALLCLSSRPGIVVHSTLAIYRHGLHADRQGGPNTARDPKSILCRHHVAERSSGPRTHEESRGKTRDLLQEHRVQPAKTELLYPPRLRSLDRYQSSVVFSLVHDNLDLGHTFSGSRSGETSENPVPRALGKIARREFARCAAIVSKAEISRREQMSEGGTHVTWLPSRLPVRKVQPISKAKKEYTTRRTDL
jgi:hypothetical protein